MWWPCRHLASAAPGQPVAEPMAPQSRALPFALSQALPTPKAARLAISQTDAAIARPLEPVPQSKKRAAQPTVAACQQVRAARLPAAAPQA